MLVLQDTPRDWRPAAFADIAAADLEAVLAAPPGAVEFVLLGTGAAQALPPRAVRESLRAGNLGLEYMATEAAVRMRRPSASDFCLPTSAESTRRRLAIMCSLAPMWRIEGMNDFFTTI